MKELVEQGEFFDNGAEMQKFPLPWGNCSVEG
jgi:hypothetical protein